jgi:hypothetical protein
VRAGDVSVRVEPRLRRVCVLCTGLGVRPAGDECSELSSDQRSAERASDVTSRRLRAATPVTTDCVDCERLCCECAKPGVAGELDCRESRRPSVRAFCRGGSMVLGYESSRDLRLRVSAVEALRPRTVCVGERTGCAGDLFESGLVSLVCRDVVRLLGDVGTGLFALSDPCLAPFVLQSWPGLERWRPLPRGECEPASRSVLISRLGGESPLREPRTTVSASDSFGPSSWSSSLPWCGCGLFSLDDDEAARGAWRGERGLRGRPSAAAHLLDAFSGRSPLLVITHVGDRTLGILPHAGLERKRQEGGRRWALGA